MVKIIRDAPMVVFDRCIGIGRWYLADADASADGRCLLIFFFLNYVQINCFTLSLMLYNFNRIQKYIHASNYVMNYQFLSTNKYD